MFIDAVAAPSGQSRVQASSVHFTPGARTAWHTHPNGQTIFVTEGMGLCQRRGEPVEVIRPGDRVFFEPEEEHWHGATPDRFMTHIAIVDVDDEGNAATWGDHVTDDGIRRRTLRAKQRLHVGGLRRCDRFVSRRRNGIFPRAVDMPATSSESARKESRAHASCPYDLPPLGAGPSISFPSACIAPPTRPLGPPVWAAPSVAYRGTGQARSRTRTDDPLLTMEVLYQLSYPGGGLTIAPGSSARTRTPVRRRRRRRIDLWLVETTS